MAFYPCRVGGNSKPFDLYILADSGSTNSSGQINGSVSLPYSMIKKVELYSLGSENYDGTVTLTALAWKYGQDTSDNHVLATRTMNRSDISKSNPLTLDLTNVDKCEFIYINLSGTNWNYSQKGWIKVYPR